nr:GNAT family N-acetyltransferase [Pyrinomonadaceae bacterium]
MVTDASVIYIREITEISELRAVEDLQKEVWGCNDREILPTLTLVPLLEIGGILLGAFARVEMVGYVLGLPGLDGGRPILHSDMLAVKAEYRSHGLGYKLKLLQREQALAKGIDRITWTFDPLQSRNAYLNFAKLGVKADRYKVN